MLSFLKESLHSEQISNRFIAANIFLPIGHENDTFCDNDNHHNIFTTVQMADKKIFRNAVTLKGSKTSLK